MHCQEEALALNSVDSIKASNPELSTRAGSSSSNSGPPSKSSTGPAAPQSTTHRAADASEPPSGPPSAEGAAGGAVAAAPELEGCTLKGSGINWSVFYGNVLAAGKWLRSSD